MTFYLETVPSVWVLLKNKQTKNLELFFWGIDAHLASFRRYHLIDIAIVWRAMLMSDQYAEISLVGYILPQRWLKKAVGKRRDTKSGLECCLKVPYFRLARGPNGRTLV